MRFSQGSIDLERFQHRLPADGHRITWAIDCRNTHLPTTPLGQPEVRARKAGVHPNRLLEQVTAPEESRWASGAGV